MAKVNTTDSNAKVMFAVRIPLWLRRELRMYAMSRDERIEVVAERAFRRELGAKRKNDGR